ncbi:MAG: hypothetical protein QOD90_5633 [Mycobacterium sp.]|jgi:hypothetical protein|nr:hypothetical protein [Mycobacterium sp.]
MSRLLERLLIWLADVLDRSVLTVQKADDEWPPPVGRNGHRAPVPSTPHAADCGYQAHSASSPSSSERQCK